MDTKSLEVFLSASKFLNFTKAANELHLTQPAVSHQITELENILGAKLFHRTSHHVELTAEGVEFAKHAQKIVSLTGCSHPGLFHSSTVTESFYKKGPSFPCR